MQFVGCTNVLIEGVTLIDAPFWVVHPVFCTNVIVRGITIDSPHINNDGVDPDACVDVLIERNVITSGDDCVAIKSGRDADAWQVGQPSRNLIVRNNTCYGPGNGFAVGSELSGGVENVYIQQNTIVAGETALDFKSNLDRGAWVKDIVVDGLTAGQVSGCLSWTNDYHGGRGGHFPTLFQNFSISNVQCAQASKTAISAVGLPDMPIREVILQNVTVSQAETATKFKHTKGFDFTNVQVNGKTILAPSS